MNLGVGGGPGTNPESGTNEPLRHDRGSDTRLVREGRGSPERPGTGPPFIIIIIVDVTETLRSSNLTPFLSIFHIYI